MAWENIARKQADLLTRLFGDSLARWRAAKAAGAAYTADQMARDIVAVWSRALDAWWGPFNSGDPTIPTLLIQSAPNNAGPVNGEARLAYDVPAAAVRLTPLGLIGGNQVFGGNVAHNVVNGSILQLTIANVPAFVPNSTNLYQGVAMHGNEPIALLMVKVG